MAGGAKFIVNEEGEKVSVILEIQENERLLEELDELDCIGEYDAAKASGETPIPFVPRVKEMQHRKE